MTYAVVQSDRYPKLYGGAAEMWGYKGREVILHGPYETGKTFAVLTKLHALLCKYPRSQALAVRATYTSLISSACQTYDNKVLVHPPGHPDCPIEKYGGESPKFYLYPNGSRIWLGGLDNPDKFLSAEFDFVYVNQAEEIDLDSWETLTGRASGRAANAPYTQVLGDCNPGPPGHWILNRNSTGKLKLIQQLHEHNPTLYDQQTGEITERGKVTMDTLDSLTGVRYQRGRLGLWVQAEGVIYDNFDFDKNVSDDAEYNPDWDVFWGVDDGYSSGAGEGTISYHPRVILLGQVTPTGGLNIFYEYLKTNELSERSIDEVLRLPYREPALAYCDSSAAELRGRIWERGIQTMAATHKVSEGIKNVRRLVCDGKGVRQLKIHSRCKHTIREFQSYRYNENNAGVNAGEPAPMKLDDHCLDALRYMAQRLRYNE